MSYGKITGRSATHTFSFSVHKEANPRKFEYVKVKHLEGYEVLAQIVEIEKEEGLTKATCNILGFRDQNNVLKSLRTPLEPDSEVDYAEDSFVEKILGLGENKTGAYFGVLEGREKIKVYLDLNRLITRHVAILAKTGSGKSYSVSVLLEEILDKGIPLIILDPHGEYSSLKYPNPKKENFERFGIKPKGYSKQIQEFSVDVQKNPEAQQLKLNSKNLSGSELLHLLPAKLSSSQVGMLYSALMDLGKSADFEQLLINLQLEENPAKWTLITIIDYLKKLNLFSDNPTKSEELVQPGKCSIINLRGVPQELQEIVAYKILSDLFNARKNSEIAPFFLVIEESHNFVPERSYGEVKSSSIIRQIAAEGRKFGVGMAVISQRAARLEKNVLSQTNTQIILKLTNPGDLKAVSSSIEGITTETEKEISNLHIGNALVVGVVDMPLFVEVRPRKTKHGGEAVDILEAFSKPENLVENTDSGETISKEVLNVIQPKIKKEDIRLMSQKKIKSLKTILVPCLMLNCKQKNFQFNLLINLHNAHLVKDFDRCTGEQIYGLEKLSDKEKKIFDFVKTDLGEFTAAQLFSKSGMQFSEIYDIFNGLVRKSYFEKSGNNYKLSRLLQTYNSLSSFSCYEKNEFMRVEQDEIQDKKVDKQEICELLKNFLEVLGMKECYFIKYDVEYA